MAEYGINMSEVLAIYRESGKTSEDPTFDIEYRKAGGDYGIKRNVRRAAGKGHLNKGKVLGSAPTDNVEDNVMKMHLYSEDGERFEVFICLLVKFNGLVINHKY